MEPGTPGEDRASTALRRLDLLDSPPQASFDRLTRLLARLLGVPVAMLSLIDGEHQFLLSQVGLGEPDSASRQTPLTHAFCELLARGGAPLAISDAREDGRLAGDPAIAEPGVVAYAGMPIFFEDECLGCLCAVDEEQRDWTDEDLAVLADVAAMVGSELALRGALLDRDHARLALEDSAEHLRRTFDAASVAMIVVSLAPASAGRILRVNQACCDFLGRSERSLVGTHFLDITHPDDRPLSERTLESVLGGGRTVVRHLEKRYLHADGHPIWGELTSSRIDPAGDAPYLISIVDDITERKQAELDLPAIANVLRRILSGEDAREAIVQAAVDIAGASSAHLAERAGPDKLTVSASAGLNLVGRRRARSTLPRQPRTRS